MKIFRISPHTGDKYCYIDYKTALDSDFIDDLTDGLKMSSEDVKNNMKLKNKTKKIPDILGTSSAEFLMSEKVKLIIKEHVKDIDINFIPFEIEGHNFWLLNTIGHINCFDYESSNYTKYRSGNPDKVYDLKLDHNQIPEYAIFRIKEKSISLFITEKLKNLFENSGITGITYSDNMDLTVGI